MTREEGNKPTRHHRKPKSIGGCNEPENISVIRLKKHVAWHILFGDMCAKQIAEEINKYYLDPSFKFVARGTGYVHPRKGKK